MLNSSPLFNLMHKHDLEIERDELLPIEGLEGSIVTHKKSGDSFHVVESVGANFLLKNTESGKFHVQAIFAVRRHYKK